MIATEGRYGTIITSTDGIIWVKRYSGGSGKVRSVSCSSSMCVGAGDGGLIVYGK